ncbi:hypothetical protein IFM89_014521 [Coptis chinensis]|uniref:Uncharacterized protein n=1 Tax=Coptis chinensis TaxID=261450 RepID=A0A835HES2_9MAGN|nr:hypothetical protein IFM89_014521 [Coptis chinensis]
MFGELLDGWKLLGDVLMLVLQLVLVLGDEGYRDASHFRRPVYQVVGVGEYGCWSGWNRDDDLAVNRAELGSLPVLNYLDLSNNQFVRNIPVEVENLKLNKFNLSYNYLNGALPPFYVKEWYRYSFLGNPELCADLEGLNLSRRREEK